MDPAAFVPNFPRPRFEERYIFIYVRLIFLIILASNFLDLSREAVPHGAKCVLVENAVDWTLTRDQFEKQKLERYQAWLKRNEAEKNTPTPPKK